MSNQLSYVAKTIPLPKRLSPGNELIFLRAATFVEPRLPFAIVFYELDGKEEESGLRLDLHKLVFLDHFEDDAIESLAREAAPGIAYALADDRFAQTVARY